MFIDIPNVGKIELKNIVLDYNGTLAKDGIVNEKVKFLIRKLSEDFKIFVITSDTYGNAAKNLSDTSVELFILTSDNHTLEKKEFVRKLKNVFAVGNGSNDSLMLKEADIGVCVIEEEGASVKSIVNADIICKNISDALELLKNPKRIVATLRE